LLTESLLIAVLGGALGLLLAQFGVAAFAGLDLPSDIPVRVDVRIDPYVLWYTLFATLASAVLFGLVPAIQASKSDLVTSLKASPEGSQRRNRLIGRNTLVVAQVAGSLVLLVFASQIYKGTQYVLHSPMGFRNTGMIMASFNPKLARYTKEQSDRFYRDLLKRAREMRGARGVALAQYPPTSPQQDSARLLVEGYDPGQGVDAVTTLAMTVSDGYFETLGISIVEGRGFTVTDDDKAPAVIVVNEQFVKKYFTGGRAIGKSVRLDKRDGQRFEIVGVAKQSKYTFAFEPPVEMAYFALPQHRHDSMMLFAQSEGPSAALADPVRRMVNEIDSQMPLLAVRTIEEYCENRSTKVINLLSETFASMAGIGVSLAAAGLYALMSFNVARRVREIGIRMALGANRPDVIGMVVKHGLILAGIGVALGLAISTGLSRFFSQSLGIPPFHIPLVGWAVLGMMAVAGLGALVPAFAASRVDPARVMRQE
jgi:predicted permease